MPRLYAEQDNGFSFKKVDRSKLYHDTNQGFDFKRSNQSGLYAPSRNGFDFKRSGQPSGHELKRASGGAVTQPAMPNAQQANQNPAESNAISRNYGNLPQG